MKYSHKIFFSFPVVVWWTCGNCSYKHHWRDIGLVDAIMFYGIQQFPDRREQRPAANLVKYGLDFSSRKNISLWCWKSCHFCLTMQRLRKMNCNSRYWNVIIFIQNLGEKLSMDKKYIKLLFLRLWFQYVLRL